MTDLTYLGELGSSERLDFGKTAWKKISYFLFSTNQETGYPTDRQHDYRLEWFLIDDLPAFFWPEQKKLIDQNRGKIESLLKRFEERI